MDERAAAEVVAEALDLRGAFAVACPMCLFGVACDLDSPDPRALGRATRYFAPLLWDEGLDAAAKAALEGARKAGVPGVEEAIADVAARGPRSFVFLAVVRRLARMQREEATRAYTTSQN
jgi:hypothetical protein